MPSLDGLLIVVAAGFAAPFLLGLAPTLRIPAVVVEIVAGIIVGPSVLGWVELDATIEVLATLGLAFLLFLGGLELALIGPGEAAALVGAGLLSVLLLPAVALALLQARAAGRFGTT